MTEDFNSFVKKWLEMAENDLLAAKIIADSNPMILDIACFHCQQGSEKYLKAFLAYNKLDIPKTHDIDFLLDECIKLNKEFEAINPKNINQYDVRFRYPHDAIIPSVEQTKEYFQIANQIKELVLKNIKL